MVLELDNILRENIAFFFLLLHVDLKLYSLFYKLTLCYIKCTIMKRLWKCHRLTCPHLEEKSIAN